MASATRCQLVAHLHRLRLKSQVVRKAIRKRAQRSNKVLCDAWTAFGLTSPFCFQGMPDLERCAEAI